MRGPSSVISSVLAALIFAPLSHAQPAPAGPSDAERALALATYAFEYRDFARVIATLEPWVHPPRIADRARLAEAQRLLGVSLHITGEGARAEQEFARVLEFDPQIQLDPFLVPPAVIETFERVRTSMRPVLDRILAEKKLEKPIAVKAPAPALVLSPVFAYAPLGLSHFLALEEPGWGALWLSLQALGLAANVIGFFAATGLQSVDAKGHPGLPPPDEGAFDAAVSVQLGGLFLFAAAWLGSGLHAHARWPNPDVSGYPPTAISGSGFTLRFD